MTKKKTYPAQRDKSKIYKKYWKRFLPKITERDNFHEAHLETLDVLCDLYEEYQTLTQFLKENGYTYESDGRYGESVREWPQVKIKQKTVSEIRQYSNMLDLKLHKDQANADPSDFDEWQ